MILVGVVRVVRVDRVERVVVFQVSCWITCCIACWVRVVNEKRAHNEDNQ